MIMRYLGNYGGYLLSKRLAAIATGVGLLSFGVLGTIAALWPNPLFIRMTPVGGWEIGFLSLQSVLLGLYAAFWRPTCSIRTVGVGGVLNFLGIACPVCNKVLLLLFGANALMTYYEPLRLYLALLGVVLSIFALFREWTSRFPSVQTSASSVTERDDA
jgi:hypothetical protein